MITTDELFKQKPLPKWISSHPVFKEVDQIKKVFPKIGLSNSEGVCSIDNSNAAKKSAKKLLLAIRNNIIGQRRSLKAYEKEHPKTSDARKEKIAKCIELLELLRDQLKTKDDCITSTNGKTTLNLTADITLANEQKPLLRKGESIFRVYNKVSDQLKDARFNGLSKLEDIIAFKEFSTDNIPNDRFKIVFSSEGADGIWDIATMSMRGVSSCQSWTGEYKHCLIGSLIDPFVGIMYLTSGAKHNEYGSKMIKRCVVRFAINQKTKKPIIVLDNMYPQSDPKILAQFKEFIKTKTESKFDVVYAPQNNTTLTQSYMPLTEVRKVLQNYGRTGKSDVDKYDNLSSIASYQDYHIKSANPESRDEQAVLFEKNSKKKEGKFVKRLTEALTTAVKEAEVAAFPNATRPVIRKLKGNDKNYWNQAFVINELGSTIARAIIKTVDKKSFNNSDTYIRRVYYSYFLNKTKVIDGLKAKLSRDLNGKLNLNQKEKLTTAQITALMKPFMPQIDAVMKENLMKLVEKRKQKYTGPLPLPA